MNSQNTITKRTEIRFWNKFLGCNPGTFVARFAATFAIMAMASMAPAQAGTVYVAPNGQDANDGSTPDRAILTLDHAVDVALARSGRSGEAMTVSVAAGTYRGQTVVLEGRRLTAPVTIRGDETDPTRYPVFVGDGKATWLTLQSSNGKATGLTISRLRIARYNVVASLAGNRSDTGGFNSGTTITDNVFNRIGDIGDIDGPASTAAIRLVNSRDNVITNNYFHTVRNRTTRECSLIHPVYMAHYSSGNRIEGNTFEDFCGPAIKLRDRANSNSIVANRFKTADRVSAIDEWYCDREASTECTKADGECPSTGNIARDNRFALPVGVSQITVRGNRQTRPWCAVSDFANARVTTR